MPKIIIFDIVGTLVSHEHFFTAIAERLPGLSKHNLSARLLGFAWLECAEREYTYLSLSGKYVPFATVFESLFWRVLHSAGVTEPRKIATGEDVKALMQEYQKCQVRPGAKQCIDTLRANDWTVWAFTNGDRERVEGYFHDGSIAIDASHIITCDEIGVGKPELRAYKKVREKIGLGKDEEAWFAAAHGWDVSAAGRSGFKTAYCTVLEKYELEEVFGKSDVVADGLVEMAEKVVGTAKDAA
ncbi:HAD-like protein [Ophiobolus disseminans]|uniref:HAD-like protein n=1 Tax=Ophiobolus disseminans TaxID=1469910 RepID=A0A6A6ZYC8_9PLEO|nr:HAD-like protein [Ophiobolus disseminans]